MKYFEVSTADDRNIETLFYWVANVGTKNYDRVESVRYIKNHVKEEKDRMCKCAIF